MDEPSMSEEFELALRRFQHLIRDFCSITGLDEAEVLASCQVEIAGVVVGLVPAGPLDPTAMQAIVDLGAPPPGEEAERYRCLLIGNLLLPASRGTFAIVPETGHCALVARIDIGEGAGMDGRRLAAMLHELVDSLKAMESVQAQLGEEVGVAVQV